MENSTIEQDQPQTPESSFNKSGQYSTDSASKLAPKHILQTPKLFFIVVFSVLLVSVAVILFYFFYQQQAEQSYLKPLEMPSTANSEMTPTGESNTEEKTAILEESETAQPFESGLKQEGKGYRITILPGWSVEQTQLYNYGSQESDETHIILASNPSYRLRIAQGGISGFRCVYQGETVRDNTNDQLFEDYVEITDQDGHLFRRARMAGGIPKELEDILAYDVCEYIEDYPDYFSSTTINMYVSPTTSYDSITYKTDNPPDEKILTEMDQMLATLENLSVGE